MNPWTSIWTRPRDTIQHVIETNPEKWVLLLAAISGVVRALDRASARASGDHLDLPVIIGISVSLGAIFGAVTLYIAAFLIRWTGKWLGGRGSLVNIRAALAWSNVPLVWSVPLIFIEIALFGKELFSSKTPLLDANPTLQTLLLLFFLVEITLSIWALVIFSKALGQVQGFSAWRGLGNGILAGLVVAVPIILFVAIFLIAS